MKILYLDFLYPEGHIRQNTTYISCLSKIAEVYVLSPKGRYDCLPPEVEVIENDSLEIKEGKFLNRFSSLKIMLISALEARKLKPDYIFVSSYETIVFAIGRLFFRKKDRLFLLNHFNVDELSNKVKSSFFKIYKHKVNHIVFEDFIENYLIETHKLDKNKIHILPHQLNENLSEASKKNIYNCVGLSNSNDEEVIAKIIDTEKKKKLIKKAGYKIILKSKSMDFDNGFLKVIKGFLNSDKYNEYINNCQCIYMPFPSSFRYRMSGTLVDALSNNKKVLGRKLPLFQAYAGKYPSICKVADNIEDICQLLLNSAEANTYDEEFRRFKEEHSESNLLKALMKIFREII